MDRRKRYRQIVALMSMLSETGTIDNVDIATFYGNGRNLLSLIVGVDPVQSGSGDPSPENIRPITGWTACNILHSGADTSDPAIYTIAFPSEAGTVYGGTLDVTNGTLTVDRTMRTFDGSSDEVWQLYSGNRFVVKVPDYTSPDTSVTDTLMSNYLRTMHKGGQGSSKWVISGSDPGQHEFMTNLGLSTVAQMRDYLAENPLEVSYPLATPIVIDLDPVQIATIANQINNIWADTGKIIFLEYEA